VLIVLPFGVARATGAACCTEKPAPPAWLEWRGASANAGAVRGSLRTMWRFDAGKPVRALAIAGGIFVVGTETHDADAAPNAFARDQRGAIAVLEVSNGESHLTESCPQLDPW